MMLQRVTLTRHADRHRDAHIRDFAETLEWSIKANDLPIFLLGLSEVVDGMNLGTGRFTILISNPFESGFQDA